MSLKKVVAIAFAALVLFFLFGTLAMAWDHPTWEHPWDNVNRPDPKHQHNAHSWLEESARPWYEHPEQDGLFRPDPTRNQAHPWGDEENCKRPDPTRTNVHTWGGEE